MSLINVFLGPSRAIIGVDTEASLGITGEYRHVSKMMVIPHANLILAGRGSQAFTVALFNMLMDFNAREKMGIDFDNAASAMPLLFDTTYVALEAARKSIEVASCFGEEQIVLIGWSKRNGRMSASAFSKCGIDDRIEITHIEDPGYVIPWSANWGDAPEGDDIDTMIDLVRLQVANVKRESPATAMGGKLVIAELTHDRLLIHSKSAEEISRNIFNYFPSTYVFGQSAIRRSG